MSHFNIDANKWDTPEKLDRARLMANKIKEDISFDKKVDILDFGCGTGLLGFEFIDCCSTLLGVDTSSGMLEVFEEKAKDYPNINTLNIDLEKQSIDKRFDLIISSMTFHHLDCPDKILSKFTSMLNANGKIMIIDLEAEDGTFHPDNEGMGVKHFGFSKEELSKWAEESSLQVETSSIFTIEKNSRGYSLFLAKFS